MLETVKAIARAIAATNGHPDPEDYADQVAATFTAQNEPAPAAPTEPAATTESAAAA